MIDVGRRVLCAYAKRFRRACEGSIAVSFALALPPISLAAVAAVQLYYVYSIHSQTQDVADSAALWGASQMALTPVGADSRTQQWASSQLSGISNSAAISITASQAGEKTMSVNIYSVVPSFFGNMLPAGGFKISASATAIGASSTPLCILVTAPSASDSLTLSDTAKLQTTCLVQSDSTLTVASGATLTAGAIAAVTSASGTMTPTANTGAPVVTDPFASLATAAPASCSTLGAAVTYSSNASLPAGTYCYPINVSGSASLTMSGGGANYIFGGGVTISGSATVTLSGGNFYFAGPLSVSGSAVVNGSDVVLDFVQSSSSTVPSISLSGSSSIAIKGRQSGALAGFVLIVDKTVDGSFALQSDYITALTGTVYSPTASLQVTGTKKAIQASDWTVIDAKSLLLSGAPDLVINSGYSTSTVPVPLGVGPSTAGVTRLTQ